MKKKTLFLLSIAAGLCLSFGIVSLSNDNTLTTGEQPAAGQVSSSSSPEPIGGFLIEQGEL